MAKTSAYQQAKKLQTRNKTSGAVVVDGQKEPDCSLVDFNNENYSNNMIHALNFANMAFEPQDLKKFSIKYITNTSSKDVLEKVAGLSDQSFTKIGPVCWLMLNGAKLSDTHVQFYEKELNDMLNKEVARPVQENTATTVERKTIQDYIRQKANEYAEKLEEVIDTKAFTLDVYAWLQKEEVKGAHVPFIIEHFAPWAQEVKEFESIKRKANKSDLEQQLVDAYSSSNAKENAFIQRMISELELFGKNQKVQRKPRKTKKKSADKLVAKMNFKQEDTAFKIVSVPAETIIGANQLWVFNTKTRQLGVYKALDASGLFVKGTTISGFNETESVSKKVRKPEDILPKVTGGGKVFLRNCLTDIKAVENKLTGRINSDTVLLKVI